MACNVPYRNFMYRNMGMYGVVCNISCMVWYGMAWHGMCVCIYIYIFIVTYVSTAVFPHSGTLYLARCEAEGRPLRGETCS